MNNKNKMKYNTLDLFCGCGGSTNGLVQNKEINMIAGIDYWNRAIESYQHNFQHLGICQDLTTYSPEQFEKEYQIKKIDIISGSPPCQGFSQAGKRDILDTRNTLYEEYIKYIDYFQPKAIIMENVMGLLSMKNKEGENIINSILEKLKNYHYIVQKLYASDFQVPQNRRRVFIIGIRKDLNIIPDEMEKIISDPKDRIPISSILEDRTHISESLYLSQKAIDGINRKKEKSKREGKGFGAQICPMDKPSFTISARYWKDGYDCLIQYEDGKIRRLTELELKRIQTFGDDYILRGTKKEKVIQIGNAVASRMMFYIGKHVIQLLNLANKE